MRRKFGKDFSVQKHIGGFKLMDKRRVVRSLFAQGGVKPDNPKRALVAL